MMRIAKKRFIAVPLKHILRRRNASADNFKIPVAAAQMVDKLLFCALVLEPDLIAELIKTP